MDSVASVLRVFTKLIERLEKIQAKEEKKQMSLETQRLKIQEKVTVSKAELKAAANAKAKLQKFLED